VPSKRHARWYELLAIVALLLLLVALFTVPFTTSFSTQFTSVEFVPASGVYSFPDGSFVSGSWSTSDGGSVTFTILAGGGQALSSVNGAQGVFSFTATDSPYEFRATSVAEENVSLTGNYRSPLLMV
jgi:hypothetical protein